MILVGNAVLSDDLKEHFFVCNLEKCKGACCVEGDAGAPLEEEEISIIEAIYPKVKKYLSQEGIKAIEEQGTWVIDQEGEKGTPTINNRECAYAITDDHGILKCGIEEAHIQGDIDYKKPISCHLYPVRVTKYEEYDALNYDRWDICSPACGLGKELNVPIYKFVKDALIRKYGEAWYQELVEDIEGK